MQLLGLAAPARALRPEPRLPWLFLLGALGGLPEAAADRPARASRGPVSLGSGFPHLEAPAAEDACDWSVTYDAWIPTFDAGEYEPVAQGGLHCLVACCADPTCMGLAMESIERYQCYKYSSVPSALSAPGYQRRDLGDSAWLLQRPAKWSVFVKRARPGVQQPMVGLPGAVSPVSKESALDEKLRQVQAMHMPQQGQCGWMVHYDRWIDTFEAGEYEGVQQGGAHCLEVCCKDPSCLGLAMESSEMYQCYKYSALPTGLLAGHQPRNLSDGVWLLEKKPAWSIFIKAGHVVKQESQARPSPVQALPQPAAPGRPALDAPTRRLGRQGADEGGTSWFWRVLQVLLVTVAFFLAHRFASSLAGSQAVERLLRSGAGGFEGTKLLNPGLSKVPL